MAAAVKHLRILNSSSRTKLLTFNLEQIPFVVLVVAAIFPLLSHYLSLFLCPCLCVCLFVCLPICLCTLSAASCICHCQRGAPNTSQLWILHNFFYTFCCFFVSLTFCCCCCICFPYIALNRVAVADAVDASSAALSGCKLTHKEEQPHHHRHHTRERERESNEQMSKK